MKVKVFGIGSSLAVVVPNAIVKCFSVRKGMVGEVFVKEITDDSKSALILSFVFKKPKKAKANEA